MVESGLGSEIEGARRSDRCGRTLGTLSATVKAVVVLFPLPAAFVSRAPEEMKLAAVYVTLLTLAVFLALAEIAGGLRRLAAAADRQRGTDLADGRGTPHSGR
ncbi:MAG: hypothetical protein MUC88_26655, partial [Planctomycetes bacterium]|nr:hypothetical protein [Planctomycetota bacterium]